MQKEVTKTSIQMSIGYRCHNFIYCAFCFQSINCVAVGMVLVQCQS